MYLYSLSFSSHVIYCISGITYEWNSLVECNNNVDNLPILDIISTNIGYNETITKEVFIQKTNIYYKELCYNVYF